MAEKSTKSKFNKVVKKTSFTVEQAADIYRDIGYANDTLFANLGLANNPDQRMKAIDQYRDAHVTSHIQMYGLEGKANALFMQDSIAPHLKGLLEAIAKQGRMPSDSNLTRAILEAQEGFEQKYNRVHSYVKVDPKTFSPEEREIHKAVKKHLAEQATSGIGRQRVQQLLTAEKPSEE